MFVQYENTPNDINQQWSSGDLFTLSSGSLCLMAYAWTETLTTLVCVWQFATHHSSEA
jgi:hypothetical protein